MKKIQIISVVGLVAILLIGAYSFMHMRAPSGYHKANDYIANRPGGVSCLALKPECGYCPGIIKNGNCYIKD